MICKAGCLLPRAQFELMQLALFNFNPPSRRCLFLTEWNKQGRMQGRLIRSPA